MHRLRKQSPAELRAWRARVVDELLLAECAGDRRREFEALAELFQIKLEELRRQGEAGA